MASPGRRRGNPKTREELLRASRSEFAEHGFDKASIRQIATRAGVDPSLVYHYFADKTALFAASIDLPFDPRQAIAGAFEEPSLGGKRLAELFLSIWEMDEPREALLGILRGMLGGNTTASEAIRSTLVATIKTQLDGTAPGPDSDMRAMGIVSQLIGVALVRYVLEAEPLATATPEDVVDLIGPRLQTYIDS